MRKRIGIFGGSFDPPHIGHLILAGEAVDFLKLDQLLWVLTPDPPHKKERSLTCWEHRLSMLEGCLGGNPQFRISRIDIDRPSPHYALDTMRLLSKEYPTSEQIYVMGGDSLFDLPNWYKPQEFVQSCSLIGVMHRPGYQINLENLESKLPGLKSKIRFFEIPKLDVSSSEIRLRILKKRTFRYFVTESVFCYIKNNHLYEG